ncbi:hypothetical protein GQR58_015793 [Nymphon striatum]|nr:hypothetical protein GQR58_015793 [Nymphon striatum]
MEEYTAVNSICFHHFSQQDFQHEYCHHPPTSGMHVIYALCFTVAFFHCGIKNGRSSIQLQSVIARNSQVAGGQRPLNINDRLPYMRPRVSGGPPINNTKHRRTQDILPNVRFPSTIRPLDYIILGTSQERSDCPLN